MNKRLSVAFELSAVFSIQSAQIKNISSRAIQMWVMEMNESKISIDMMRTVPQGTVLSSYNNYSITSFLRFLGGQHYLGGRQWISTFCLCYNLFVKGKEPF